MNGISHATVNYTHWYISLHNTKNITEIHSFLSRLICTKSIAFTLLWLVRWEKADWPGWMVQNLFRALIQVRWEKADWPGWMVQNLFRALIQVRWEKADWPGWMVQNLFRALIQVRWEKADWPGWMVQNLFRALIQVGSVRGADFLWDTSCSDGAPSVGTGRSKLNNQ